MQRLVDKIVNEFQQNSDYIEIGALDGNGGKTWLSLPFQVSITKRQPPNTDSFQVYQGQIRTLAPFHFANVLRHPSCFYFFSASALPNVASPDLEDSVVQRDICWLTGTFPGLKQNIFNFINQPSLLFFNRSSTAGGDE